MEKMKEFGNDLLADAFAAMPSAATEPVTDQNPSKQVVVVPPLAMDKVHAKNLTNSRQDYGRRSLNSPAFGTSRPFVTSSNWPEFQSMKAHTARTHALNSAPSSEFGKSNPQSERSFIPPISTTSHGTRPKTPTALYTNQFFVNASGGATRGVRTHPSNHSVDVLNSPRSTAWGSNRDWQRLVVRMPGTVEPAEQTELVIVGEAIRTILGQGSTLHVHTHPSQAGNFTEMLMVEKPTSRKQAQLLSSWYYEQLHTLMSLAIPTPEELRQAGLLAEPSRKRSPAVNEQPPLAAWENLPDNEVARRLLSFWGEEGIRGHVFLHSSGHQVNIEGVTLPNDTLYTRALQHINCLSAAAVMHQVSMHCHERGKLLTQIWNAHSAMMEMELRQLAFQVQVLSSEKQRLLFELQNAGMQLSTASDKDMEIRELTAKLRRQKGDLAIKDAELTKLNTEVAELKELVSEWSSTGFQPDELEDLQDDLNEAKSDLEEAERTRDVALTALFAGVQQSAEVGQHVQKIKEDLGGKLSTRDMQEMEEMFKRMDTGIKNIAAMETMVENKMNVTTGSMLPGGQANFLQLMKAKHMAKKLGRGAKARLKKNKVPEKTDADKAELQSFEPKPEGTMLAPPDQTVDLEHIVETAGVTSIPEIMLEADMIDVEEMDSKAMWREIQRLRERENTLLYAMQQMMLDKQAMDDYLQNMQNDDGPQVITIVESSTKKGKKKKGAKAGTGGAGKGTASAGAGASAAGEAGAGPKGSAPPAQVISDEAVSEAMGPGATPQSGGAGPGHGAQHMPGYAPGGSIPPPQSISAEAISKLMGPGAVPLPGGGGQGQSMRHAASNAPGGMMFSPGAVPDKKKDTILMMMRAVLTSREEEVKLKKERAMRQNKAASQSAAKASSSAQNECAAKLKAAQERIQELLNMATEVHEQYTKVWNVLVASGIETGSLVPAHLLAVPRQALSKNPSKKKLNVAAAETKKLGVADKARKMMAAERVASMTNVNNHQGNQPVVAGRTPSVSEGRASSVTGHARRTTSNADDTCKSTGNSSIPEGKATDAKKQPAGLKSKMGGMMKSEQAGAGVSLKALQSVTKQAVAAKHVAFACKDSSLREAIVKHKNVKPRTKEWLLKLMDQVYKSKTAQDAKLKRDGEELTHLPMYLFAHLQAQYGAKSLVQEYAACVVATTRVFASEDVRCNTFGKFVSQEWDTPALAVHLEAAERISASPGSMNVVCCEFPENHVPSRGLPPWICTWKAMAITKMFLGKRSDACTAGFAEQLESHSCPIEPHEKAKYFWSPSLAGNAIDGDREAAAAEEETARGVSMSKLSSARFLAALCEEYVRLESVLDDAVPGLFKEHDADFSGYLDRNEIFLMLQSLHGSHFDEGEAAKVWDIAENLERIQAEEAGYDPPDGEVGVEAFSGAVKRTDAVRRYIRLYKSPPPPPELAAEHRESQSKMLYMVVERHWRGFDEAVKRILDSGALESAESNVRGQVTKMTAEKDGVHRAQMFVTLLKTLCDFMLVKIQRQCNPSVLSSAFDPMMETNLERVEKSVKVLFGWKTLLEDDRKNAAALEDPKAGLVARQKAVKDWMEQSRAFVDYKAQMQKQAAAILQKKFYRRWRRRKQGPDGAEEDDEDSVPVSHILTLLKKKD